MEDLGKRKSLPTLAVEVACIVLMAILVSLVTAQVFMRHVVHQPLTWSEEAARITFVWVTFIGAGLAFQRRENLRIMLVPDALSLRARLWLRLAVYLVELGFMGLVLYYSVPLLQRLYIAHTPALEWSQSVFYGGVTGGGLVIFGYILVGIKDTVSAIRDNRRPR